MVARAEQLVSNLPADQVVKQINALELTDKQKAALKALL